MQDNAGDDLFVTGDTTFTFPTPVTNGGIYNVQTFLPPSDQLQACNDFFYTGIALSKCQHRSRRLPTQRLGWDSWYLSGTTKANNYAAVTTPLFPPNLTFPPDLVLRAAGTSQRPGLTTRGEDGYSAEMGFRIRAR